MPVAQRFKGYNSSYSYNRTCIPFPEGISEKAKPPVFDESKPDNKELFIKKERGWEEKAQEHMDEYRKAERTLVINFYTGGTKYSRGILDSIYRGVNLLNP